MQAFCRSVSVTRISNDLLMQLRHWCQQATHRKDPWYA